MTAVATNIAVAHPLDALEKVLLEQLKVYEQYTQALQTDRELMANLKVLELEKNNKVKTTLLLRLQAMDEARKGYVAQIATQKNIAPENVKMIDLCRHLDADDSSRLLKLRERLTSTISQLRRIQSDTAFLAQSSLAWINSSMATLRGMLTPTGTYNLQGKVDHPGVFAGHVVERQV